MGSSSSFQQGNGQSEDVLEPAATCNDPDCCVRFTLQQYENRDTRRKARTNHINDCRGDASCDNHSKSAHKDAEGWEYVQRSPYILTAHFQAAIPNLESLPQLSIPQLELSSVHGFANTLRSFVPSFASYAHVPTSGDAKFSTKNDPGSYACAEATTHAVATTEDNPHPCSTACEVRLKLTLYIFKGDVATAVFDYLSAPQTSFAFVPLSVKSQSAASTPSMSSIAFSMVHTAPHHPTLVPPLTADATQCVCFRICGKQACFKPKEVCIVNCQRRIFDARAAARIMQDQQQFTCRACQ